LFKIVIGLVAVFISTSSGDRQVERLKVDETKETYATLSECRAALKSDSKTQGEMASAVNKLNEWVEDLPTPDGYEFKMKRLRAVCFPADLPPAAIKEALRG
jgi:hypothetical protein